MHIPLTSTDACSWFCSYSCGREQSSARLSVVARATKGGKTTKAAKGKGATGRKTVRDRAGWWGEDSSLGQWYGAERGLYLGESTAKTQ